MEYKEERAGQIRPAREASATSKGFKQQSDSSIRPLKRKAGPLSGCRVTLMLRCWQGGTGKSGEKSGNQRKVLDPSPSEWRVAWGQLPHQQVPPCAVSQLFQKRGDGCEGRQGRQGRRGTPRGEISTLHPWFGVLGNTLSHLLGHKFYLSKEKKVKFHPPPPPPPACAGLALCHPPQGTSFEGKGGTQKSVCSEKGKPGES